MKNILKLVFQVVNFGGVQWTSLIDYPDTVCTTLFTVGCNFRCPYCYNRSLVLPEEFPPFGEYPSAELMQKLISRQKLVSAVTLTGGEPTLHKDLPEFISNLKENGFKVKLDTNGTAPQMIQTLLADHLLDFIAVDYKAPAEQYDELVGMPGAYELVEQTLNILCHPTADIPVEIRTTFPPPLLEPGDLTRIAKELQQFGVKRYALQMAINPGTGFVIRDFKLGSIDRKAIHKVALEISSWFEEFILREN